MALRPGAALLTFTNAASTTVSLYVNEVTLSKVVEPFQRVEFSNQRQRETKNPAGGTPIIVNTIANVPIQIGITCAGDLPRPLTPDSISNLNAINQRFNIQRYTITGAPTPIAALDTVLAVANTHAALLQKFQYHIIKSTSDLSYPDLVTLQSENFSFLTSTGISISGNCIGGTATEMLVTSFNQNVSHSITQADGSQLRMAEWSMVIENRTISSQSAS